MRDRPEPVTVPAPDRSRLLAAACAFVLVGIGSIPRAGGGPEVPHLDKLVHALLYASLGAATARAALRAGRPARTAIALGLLAALVTGAIDEIHQRWIPGRTPDVADVGADLAGGALGALGFVAWATRARATASLAPDGGSA